MEIWNSCVGEFVEMPKNISDFLDEIESVCKKYGYSISHEDYMGSFILVPFSEREMGRLWNASMDMSE